MENKDLHIDQLLGEIKRVDTPPFLFTRIQAKLHQDKTLPTQWSFTYLTIGVATMAINFLVVFSSLESSTYDNSSQSISSVIDINPSYQLYND